MAPPSWSKGAPDFPTNSSPALSPMTIRQAVEADAVGIAEVLHAIGGLQAIGAEPISSTAEKVADGLRRGAISKASAVFLVEAPLVGIVGYCAVY